MSSRDKEILEVYKDIFSGKSPSLSQYDFISLEARFIFGERNKLYGDAFKETGVFGTFAVLAGDVARLRKMIYKESPPYNEINEIKDKLLDVINQSIITIMMLKDNNWTGEEQE